MSSGEEAASARLWPVWLPATCSPSRVREAEVLWCGLGFHAFDEPAGGWRVSAAKATPLLIVVCA
jgi:hypothetical protein